MPEGHGLAICYNTNKVKVLKQFDYVGVLEMLPVLLKVDNEMLFLVVVYRRPGPIGNFVSSITQEIGRLLQENPICGDEVRSIIIGDFNYDQLLDQHAVSLSSFSSHFNFHQRSKYSTHIKGGILDLVFDNKKTTDVEWMFSPFSDHFILLVDL